MEQKDGYRFEMQKILSLLRFDVSVALTCLALCVLASGCVDDSYHGAADRYKDDLIPLPVNVYVGEPASAVETKAFGSVDFKNKKTFDGHNIYVYAFNGTASTDFRINSSTNPKSCLVDGSVDDEGYLGGKQAVLSDLTNYADWTGADRPLYPTGEMKSVPYDFFAYHLDPLKPDNESIERTEDKIEINLKLDGVTDVMTAHSVYEGEKEDSLLAYSYYTARKGINPVFTFKHQLVKLVFEAEAGVVESRKNKILTVQDVKVASYEKARLTVAYKKDWKGEGMVFDETSLVPIPLLEADGSEIPRDKYTILNPPPTDDTPPMKIGGELLIAPKQTYIAYVTVKEINAAGEHEDVNEIEFEFPEGFKAGCSYLITLKLFGYMDVEPSVTLVPWNYGGDINILDYENPEY